MIYINMHYIKYYVCITYNIIITFYKVIVHNMHIISCITVSN